MNYTKEQRDNMKRAWLTVGDNARDGQRIHNFIADIEELEAKLEKFKAVFDHYNNSFPNDNTVLRMFQDAAFEVFKETK